MCNGIMALIDTDGTLREYSDEYDVVIRCKSQQEQEKFMELLNIHLKETGPERGKSDEKGD